MTEITTRRLDYSNREDMAALIHLLDIYAQDPMGGSSPLPETTRQNLGPLLQNTPHAFSILAEIAGTAAGLANCFWGASTFAARPLVNIHDVITHPDFRGRGIARKIFAHIEDEARKGGACKVTLEVLSGNHPAKKLYTALGYGDYALDPETGTALFWQKKLS